MIAALALACLVAQDIFTSRSGAKRLEVNVYGDEEFRWILRGPEGKEWERTVRHSAADAYVCEDGSVVACGITPGETGWDRFAALTILGPNRYRDKPEDERLHGELRMIELYPPVRMITHGGNFPQVEGVLVWETLDRCAFRVADFRKPDQLWTYSVSEGLRKGVIEPEVTIGKASDTPWDSLSLAKVVAPGANELFVATLVLRGPLVGVPGPGNYVGPDLCGIVGLFHADGQLLWARRMRDERFLGEVRITESTADDLRCQIDVNNREKTSFPRRGWTPIVDETLDLHFHREGTAWTLQ